MKPSKNKKGVNMRVRRLIVAITALLTLTACDKEKMERAKAALSRDESIPEIQMAVLFDNSISYKAFIEPTLSQVKGVFQHMAAKYPEAEVGLIMIDTKATIIYSGPSKDLQRAYDDLSDKLRHETSKFTNLIDAVEKGLYFLEKARARRKVMVVFSDLKHSLPDYYPQDMEVVPPPPGFPWEKIKEAGVEMYAFYVPYREWREWGKVMEKTGGRIAAKLPEELKTVKAAEILFKED
jgi:hypothetical protein